jgi:hypothetical protein
MTGHAGDRYGAHNRYCFPRQSVTLLACRRTLRFFCSKLSREMSLFRVRHFVSGCFSVTSTRFLVIGQRGSCWHLCQSSRLNVFSRRVDSQPGGAMTPRCCAACYVSHGFITSSELSCHSSRVMDRFKYRDQAAYSRPPWTYVVSLKGHFTP